MNYIEQIQAIDKAIIESIKKIVHKKGSIALVSKEDIQEGEYGECYTSIIDERSGQVEEVKILSLDLENIVAIDREETILTRGLSDLYSVEDRAYLLEYIKNL